MYYSWFYSLSFLLYRFTSWKGDWYTAHFISWGDGKTTGRTLGSDGIRCQVYKQACHKRVSCQLYGDSVQYCWYHSRQQGMIMNSHLVCGYGIHVPNIMMNNKCLRLWSQLRFGIIFSGVRSGSKSVKEVFGIWYHGTQCCSVHMHC